MSEMMVLGFENELEADRFGVKLAELQKDMIVQPRSCATPTASRTSRAATTWSA
jgi:uncharacterized membrane protein